MNIGTIFWVIMVIGLVYGFWNNRSSPVTWFGNSIVIWILLALLGWQVFGPVIHK